MKQEDFERLKKLCQENDFEIDGVMNDEGVYFIRKKNPWDGVEFVLSNWGGKIYPINQISNFKQDYEEFTPSNESLYVRQLISEAKKRFGEIVDGEIFDFSCFNDDQRVKKLAIKIHDDLYEKFEYIKKTDSLIFYGFKIYQSGKWATRVRERVEVKAIELVSSPFQNESTVKLHIGKWLDIDHCKGLASQLEAYLNKE